MGGIIIPWRGVLAAVAALLPLCGPVALGGCAADSSHAGIPLAVGAADPELQALARRAQAGDKQAQLELGMRYEEGRGVAADLGRAAQLYRMAARATGGLAFYYSPPVGGGGGQTISVDRGSEQPGLPEAESRLARLKRFHEARP